MNNFFRALLAGAAAKKFGGGCLGTIVIFVIVWVALGQCGSNFKAKSPANDNKAKKSVTTYLYPESYQPLVQLAL